MSAQHSIQASHRGAPTPVTPQTAASPPSKRELASWWKNFRKTTKKEEEKVSAGIFGVPLADSIKYANVAISLTNEQGESFIYGYVPIVVAKCGVYLKEKATDVEGIFRLSGSAKRIKDLQTIFNSPDRYGKGLDWTGYTVHDAANILRRYLNQLPEPLIPLDFYERFRDPLRDHQSQAVGDLEAQTQDVGNFDHDAAVITYQKLITELPALNRQLLLYILDLLAVFSSKSELNRMTSANLAAIFQPGIISHPDHDMAPQEYRLSQDVVIFLIENQDNFLVGMPGTAIDEKTSKELQNAPIATPVNKANIGRSASNASAGPDSLRRYGGVRRNVSVSSRNSRGSTGAPSPVNASTGVPFASHNSSSSMHRSNTVPSKKSPALSSTRYGKPSEPSTPTTPPVSYSAQATQPIPGPVHPPPATSPGTPVQLEPSSLAAASIPESPEHAAQHAAGPSQAEGTKRPVLEDVPTGFAPPAAAKTPTKERKISNLFSKSPVLVPADPDARQPNKLRKRPKASGSTNVSAQSSQASLHGDSPMTPAFHTPLVSPELTSHARPDPIAAVRAAALLSPAKHTTQPSQPSESPQPTAVANNLPQEQSPEPIAQTLRPPKSREPSLNSHSSVTDHSDFDALDADPSAKAEKRRHRWRFSASAKPDTAESPLQPPPVLGQNPPARGSTSSVGSSKPRKSFTGDSQLTQPTATDSSGYPLVANQSSTESEQLKETPDQTEKKAGLFGKIKAKMEKSREERREREAERERAKSPPRSDAAGSRQSLSAFAHDHFPQRGRSMEKPREGEALEAQNGTASDHVPIAKPSNGQTPPGVPNAAENDIAHKGNGQVSADVP
ncbi:putative rho gtpase activator [Phaeomoniella chlamydospora]|uniref:Putative rho gtpase activator n=1 Tax=Phaeomoniella chlamydospora TaxID=158046 RepID=A0A0G2H937_PHACM|nr:putative rho gtpase activator [Phaeomoniella chlamydospora]